VDRACLKVLPSGSCQQVFGFCELLHIAGRKPEEPQPSELVARAHPKRMVHQRRQFSYLAGSHLPEEPRAGLFEKRMIELLGLCLRSFSHFGFTAMRQVSRQLRIASRPSEMMPDSTLDSSPRLAVLPQFVQKRVLIVRKGLQV